MKTIASLACLVAGFVLIFAGLLSAPPHRITVEEARIVRLHPASALVSFGDGSFTTVPRSALADHLGAGDLIDLRVEPLGDTRFAAAQGEGAGAGPEAPRRTW